MVAPDYHPLPPALHDLDLYDSEFLSCPEAQRHMQLCPLPNGTHHLGQFPPCLPSDRASNQWVDAVMRDAIEQEAIFDGITIIVPFYPYPANIYHFSAAIATVSHVASNIDTIISHFGPDRIRPVDARDALPLNILFTRRRRKDIPWANNLERALFEGRIASALPKGTKVSYLTDLASAGSKYACVRNPISMGQRGHVNAWPFANSSEINLDGSQVPRDSIGFRSDVYKYVGVDEPPMHLLNEREADSEKANQTFGKIVGRVPVPPLVLGYSKRQGMNSTVGSGVHVAGTVRRFSEDDEEWFTEMLTYETKKVGVALKVFTPSPEEPFDLQVRRMVDVGFVVGIHGANLVNSLFMRPFGAFFEIFPANMKSMCYKAGANSGLKYLKHYAVVEATPEESGCDTSNHRCFQITRQRMVKISTEKDREGIRQNVRSGLRHIIQLNNDYSSQGGVPVTYNWVTGTYDIADWKR